MNEKKENQEGKKKKWEGKLDKSRVAFFSQLVQLPYTLHYTYSIVMSAVVNSIVTKITGLTNCATYWAKVGGELAKQVYKAEGLKPPTAKEFETVYQQALKFIKTPAEQQKLLEQAKNIKPTKETAYKAGIYGIQLLAFFSVGEVIGRRSLTPINPGH